MTPATGREPSTWRRLVGSRWLLVAWAKRDFSVRYRQSALGLAWAAAQPLLLLAVYGLMFHSVLHVRAGKGSYLVFAWCGLVPWSFLSSAIALAVPSMTTAQPILTKVYFPREVIPLASVLTTGIDLAISTALLLGLVVVAGPGLNVTALGLLPLYVGFALVIMAVAVVGSALTVFVRDIRHLIPMTLQLLFIASPVMYPASLVPARWRTLYELNPVAVAAAETRRAMIDGRWPHLVPVLALVAAGLVGCVAAVRYVRAIELRFPDVI